MGTDLERRETAFAVLDDMVDTLDLVMQDDRMSSCRRRVAEHLVAHRKGLGRIGGVFDKRVRKDIRVPGYRKVFQAPKHLLVPRIVSLMKDDLGFQMVCLVAWFRHRRCISGHIEEFLKEKSPLFAPSLCLAPDCESEDCLHMDDVFRMAGDFLLAHPDDRLEEIDAALGICVGLAMVDSAVSLAESQEDAGDPEDGGLEDGEGTGRDVGSAEPEPAEAEPAEVETQGNPVADLAAGSRREEDDSDRVPSSSTGGSPAHVATVGEADQAETPVPSDQRPAISPRWSGWLLEMESLPPDDGSWGTLGEFLSEAERIGRSKAKERDALSLSAAVSGFSGDVSMEAAYFGWEDIPSWGGLRVPPSAATSASAALRSLAAALSEHRSLRVLPPARTVAEDTARRRALEDLKDRASSLHADAFAALAPFFAPAAAPETPPDASPEPPAAESRREEEAPVVVADASPACAAAEPEKTEEAPASFAAAPVAEPCVPARIPPAPERKAEGRRRERVQALREERAQDKEPLPARSPEIPGDVQDPAGLARLLAENESPALWEAFFWSLVAQDDLAGAYWLAESLHGTPNRVSVDPRVLAAAAGARWMRPGEEMYAEDFGKIADVGLAFGSMEEEMLALAGALRPTLLSRVSWLVDWVGAPWSSDALWRVVREIKEFAQAGIGLMPEDIESLAVAGSRESMVADAAAAARQWLAQAPTKTMKLQRASVVWRDFIVRQGGLREMLEPVAANDPSRLHRSLALAREWSSHARVESLISETNRKVSRGNVSAIVADPRKQILNGVEEAVWLVNRFAEAVEQRQRVEDRGDWARERVSRLRDTLRLAVPTIADEIREIEASGSFSRKASAAALRRSMAQAFSALDPPLGERLGMPGEQWDWLARTEAAGLFQTLSRRLMLLPEVSLTDGLSPDGEYALQDVAYALRDSIASGRTVRQAVSGWIRSEDYRFVEGIASCAVDKGEIPEIVREMQDALDGSRALLAVRVAEVEGLMEQAVVDGVVSSAGFSSDVASLVYGQGAEEVLDFQRRFVGLERAKAAILSSRAERLAVLTREWESDFEPNLRRFGLTPEQQGLVRDKVLKALSAGETRVAEEWFSRLREAIEGGKGIEEEWFRDVPRRMVLEEFLEAAPVIEDRLKKGETLVSAAAGIRAGKEAAGASFGSLPSVRREEAFRAIEAWRSLKQSGAASPCEKGAGDVMAFLGFERDKDAKATVEGGGQNWVHVRLPMSASDLSRPIPQFGSGANGVYDVICLWERPGTDSIAALLQERRLSGFHPVILFLGRMSMRQRMDLSRACRSQKISALVLDEVMLLFLARQSDARLPVFLRCALPFSAVNPYTPNCAGDVPQEMFYGRRMLLREIQNPSGGCLVFGGRQLGKSALLLRAVREFHHPERRRLARHFSMQSVFDPGAGKGTEEMWSEIRDWLQEAGVLSGKIVSSTPKKVSEHVAEALARHKDMRVLALFDEADVFLDEDAKNGFPRVVEVRDLMHRTGGRFKVVFAGTHNVQRFHGIPNQPLAHLGEPMCVGPLSPADARALIREPMEALGLRFDGDGDAAILKILSYTNHHTGLVQLFCRELVERVHSLPAGYGVLPQVVRTEDIDAVYRLAEVRDAIRKRFDMTLSLDKRYMVIALAMVVDQMASGGNYAAFYPPSTSLSLARKWWPEAFEGVGPDMLRGLLDEMCGLGVLVRNSDGHYRLRSPNLVRLMGTQEDVEERVLKVSEEPPPRPFTADSHHARDGKSGVFSPMTYADERFLFPPRAGVSVLFASGALGLPDVEAAARRLACPGGADPAKSFSVVPGQFATWGEIGEWLSKNPPKGDKGAPRTVFWAGGVGSMRDIVHGAIVYTDAQGRKKPVRLFLAVGPVPGWGWSTLEREARESMENVCATGSLKRWTHDGIAKRLRLEEKHDDAETVSAVARATGGWPVLLDRIFAMSDSPREMDLRKLVAPLDRWCSGKEGASAVLAATGLLDVPEVVRSVLAGIGREKDGLPSQFVSEGYFDFPKQECEAALEFLKRYGFLDVRSGPDGELVFAEPVMLGILERYPG